MLLPLHVKLKNHMLMKTHLFSFLFVALIATSSSFANNLSLIGDATPGGWSLDSARFFGCQFIIATHSPFLLSMRGAKIYDLDEDTVDIKQWIELSNVRTYYNFFMEHRGEFGD